MMIVGAQTHPDARIPRMTIGLIVINLCLFLAQLAIGEPLDYGFSLIPAEITTGKDLVKPQKLKVSAVVPVHHDRTTKNRRQDEDDGWNYVVEEQEIKIPQYPGPVPIYLTLFTSMFMHTGWLHLIGNMWFLFLFGRNVEYALGAPLYLLFYLACGVAAGLAHVLSAPTSIIPCMGASGAISAVLGAYLFIYPVHKIKIWVGIRWLLDIPAWGALLIWGALQYAGTLGSAGEGSPVGGVAHWAHLGGFGAGFLFLCGMFVCLYLRKVAASPEELETEPETETAPAPVAEVERVAVPVPAEPEPVPAEDPFAVALATQAYMPIAAPPESAGRREKVPDQYQGWYPGSRR